MRWSLLSLAALLLAPAHLPAQVPAPRVVEGRVYAADGSGTAGVRVVVAGEVYADSARLDSTGVFSFRVPRYPIGPLEVRIGEEGEETAFLPWLLRLRPADRSEGLAAVLVPRRYTIPEGTFRGTAVPIDVVGATTRACARCAAFYRAVLGDTLPGRPPGIPTWPDSVFPLHVAIDQEVGPRLSPRDSVSFWRVADEVEAAFGRDLFEPTSLEYALDPDLADGRGVVLVSVNPSLPDAEGWGNSAAQGGDLLAAAVMMRQPSNFSGAAARFLVAHELLHALGFGHTCSWSSVVAAEPCRGRRAGFLTPEDVAHALVLWRVRAVERTLGINNTISATLAAAGGGSP